MQRSGILEPERGKKSNDFKIGILDFVAAELTNSITKLNSASRPIKALKLE